MIGEFVYGLMQTEGDILLTVLRVGLGIVIFHHGAQKLLGWFGGDGYRATMDYYTKGMGIPAGRIVCPHCELGRIRFVDPSAAHCKRCGCTLNDDILGELRRITSLPETLGRHPCECGHPEMRPLPDGIFHCPACGSEVLPAKGLWTVAV
jgi:ribosomal protein L37AE/L43A